MTNEEIEEKLWMILEQFDGQCTVDQFNAARDLFAAALDDAEARGRAAERERWTGARSQVVNDLICSCGHWYALHASGVCKTCGCANPASAIRGAGGE